MEQKFGVNSIDLQELYDFCEREGEKVSYQKGERMECEGEPSRWFGFVTKGCFKYVTQGISDGKEHITWFSFAGEFVTDYPTFLYGRPSQTTIVAMMPSRVLRVTGERLSPSAPDLLFPSASDLWFRALSGAFLCRFPYLCQTKLINNEL